MATSHRGLKEVPLHGKLSAQYKDTFAYPTIKDRCPVILCKVRQSFFKHILHFTAIEQEEKKDCRISSYRD